MADSICTEEEAQKRRRRRWTNQEKLALVRVVKRRVASGESQYGVCKDLNVDPKQYRSWSNDSNNLAKKRPKAKSTCDGMKSILAPVHDELLKFVFELREQGMSVKPAMIRLKASSVCRPFCERSKNAQTKIIQRWLKQSQFLNRMATRESQKDPRETEGIALDFIEMMRPKVSQKNRHQDFIINMDQTPVPFTFNEKRTLELVGKRTINVRKSTNDTKRVTYAATITASGKTLTPYLVFKGRPDGRIVKKEFKTYPQGMFYACQDAAWMDEVCVMDWIEKVLKPYVSTAPQDVVPLLLLDEYRCHIMGTVVTAINELGVDVEHIPGGCTCLVQPIDVGSNRPF